MCPTARSASLQPRIAVSIERNGRGWTRTSSLLFVRQVLSAIELLAQGLHAELRDKDSNLDLHVQSVTSSPLDDPGSRCPPCTPSLGDEVRAAASTLLGLCHAGRPSARRCCLCHSPTLRPWITEMRRPTWRSFGARRCAHSGKSSGKSSGLFSSEFACARSAAGPFSLRRGLESRLSCFKLSITSFRLLAFVPHTTKATLSDRPRSKRLCKQSASSHASGRGPASRRTGASRSSSARTRSSRRWPLRRGTSWCSYECVCACA